MPRRPAVELASFLSSQLPNVRLSDLVRHARSHGGRRETTTVLALPLVMASRVGSKLFRRYNEGSAEVYGQDDLRGRSTVEA